MPHVPSKYTELIDVLQHVEEAFDILELLQLDFQANPKAVNSIDIRTRQRLYNLMQWKREHFDA